MQPPIYPIAVYHRPDRDGIAIATVDVSFPQLHEFLLTVAGHGEGGYASGAIFNEKIMDRIEVVAFDYDAAETEVVLADYLRNEIECLFFRDDTPPCAQLRVVVPLVLPVTRFDFNEHVHNHIARLSMVAMTGKADRRWAMPAAGVEVGYQAGHPLPHRMAAPNPASNRTQTLIRRAMHAMRAAESPLDPAAESSI